jgi:tetratricopeptide (TPR) repeat protein
MWCLRARPLFVLTLLLFAAAAAHAQRDSDQTLPGSSLEIAGQVRSPDNRSVVPNVMVRLDRYVGGLVDQVATDSTGRFRFSRLNAGQYVVSVKTDDAAATTAQIDISRFIPRQYIILQLQPVGETFRRREPRPAAATVDARVPENARKEYDHARVAAQEKRPAETVAHLEKAIALYPDFYEAQLMLGVTDMELRQWDRAERELRRAVELRPKASAAFVALGEVYRRQKKYTDAEKTLVEALKVDQASWQGHFTLGRVYWELNEPMKAAPHVGQSLKIKPDYPEGRLLAGNIFMRLNMPENALVEYEEYLRLAPDGEFAQLTQANVKKLRQALAKKNEKK